jgi:diaminohydroxyphosphoribosylaminopyrimidine deaminase/5-amino-6-(5-phosphoribosylamino)uracil reductase
MRRALRLAARADYRTSPNPMVGAVVLDGSERLAGEGFTSPWLGGPHAEVNALRAAGDRARAGTAYVTLEPCCHQGRTPPCTGALIESGVRRVVVAIRDPDPRVNGAGIAALEEAGIEVTEGVESGPAARLNVFYLKHRTTGRPFVTAKFAASLDGRIATRSGDSRWITGEQARAHAHRLRHKHDAILVGVNTVLADDPELSARFKGARQPLKVILDSRGRTPPTAKAMAGEHLVDGGRDLPGLLERLGGMGIMSLLIEGGATVHGSFLDAGLVDRVFAYVSPVVIGGTEAPAAVGGAGPAALKDAYRLGDVTTRRLGPDLVISGYVHRDR